MARAANDNLHSRVVAWLKVLLPLTALAILSTLFLFSRTIDPSDAIPYARVDVEERARAPRVTQPSYAGVTADGALLSVSADEARPGADQGAGSATALAGLLETPDGARTELTAAQAELDTSGGLLTLSGGVTVDTNAGYHIETDALSVRLDRTGLDSPGAITATAPMGRITAAGMTLSPDPVTEGSYVLVFKGRVKLVYEPAD